MEASVADSDELSLELASLRGQQAATTAVLKVISQSAFDLKVVLDTLSESAARLCDADMSGICRREGSGFYYASSFGFPDDWLAYMGVKPLDGRGSVVGRVLIDGDAVQLADVLADPDYTFREPQTKAGFRTFLGVPLMREHRPIGVLVLARRTVSPFTEKQIELLRTFADQAVIAIENVRLFEEAQQRNRELIATSEVLRVISRSPTDVKPVLEVVAESAAKLCEAYDSVIFLKRDNDLVVEAHHGPIPLDWAARKIGRNWVTGRAVLDRVVIHIHDLTVEGDEFPESSADARRQGHRTILAVPLLSENEGIGALVIRRTEVRPFSNKEIQLLNTFADQAVIAIQNARLFEEVQQRNRELTATSEVLQVISRSPTDVQPVFDAIAMSAAQLCNSEYAYVHRFDGSHVHLAAQYGLVGEAAEAIRRAFPMLPGRGSAGARTILSKAVERIPDYEEDPEYEFKAEARLAKVRSAVAVPMLRDGVPIGAIVLDRSQAGYYPDRQVELLKTFADQAVIAMENVRLFKTVETRTEELSEALQQQTATAEVLKTISRSTFDLPAVLNALVTSAAKLCNASYGGILLREGDVLRGWASYGAASEDDEDLKAHPMRIDRKSVSGRVMLSGKIEYIPDYLADPEYEYPLGRFSDVRAILGVPLLREGGTDGVFFLARPEPGAFTSRQCELVQTFADQAVIAIENVRLFEQVETRTRELQESLDYQTATSEVLNVISRSPAQLQPVLDVIIETAVRLCEADGGTIARQQGAGFIRSGQFGFNSEFAELMSRAPVEMTGGSITGRTLIEGKVVHILDAQSDPEYTWSEALSLEDIRTGLGVPLLREGVPIGAIALVRRTVRPFTDKQIELVTTFADQAVIAIENARLFEEVQTRNRELAASLETLRAAQNRLIQTEKLASLGQLTAGIAHEIKNPLNFVNNFSAVSVEILDELGQMIAEYHANKPRGEEIGELLSMLKGNLDKVSQHGKRADSIIKNMLLHSRHGSGEHRLANVNTIVEESLNLAYHGARAERQGFNITLEKSLDPEVGEVDLYPQEITRVLLNLISNGFYATVRRKSQTNGNDYEPMLSTSTRNLGDSVEIRIRDNGTGISDEVRDKIFLPFFTTKPAGEGTGLGLSLSYDIVVKQHAGSIELDTQLGDFTEFRIVLPRTGASLARQGESP